MALQLLRGNEVDKRRARSKSQRYLDIHDGVFVPPVNVGSKISVYAEHEVDAIIAAELSGATKAELRDVVARLVAARRSLGLEPSVALQRERSNSAPRARPTGSGRAVEVA